MSGTLTRSKITAPVLPPTTLHRALLVQRLREVIDSPIGGSFSYKLILLCAPAGYGKTLLLTDFAQRTTTPCCWYFLDSTDIDEITFIKTILLSIRQRFPQFGRTFDSLLTNAVPVLSDPAPPLYSELAQLPHSFEEIVEALLAAIEVEIAERFAIFLCNYHEVSQHNGISVLVNRFLEHLPAQCIVVIESRTIPSLEFAPLITQRKILSLGRNILRFTPQEIRDLALLQGSTPPGEAEAEQIATSFDGWIAGILLGTHLGDIQFLDTTLSSHVHFPLSMIQGNRKALFSYLFAEVFGRDLATYAFLKDAAILQYMVASICNELLQINDAEEHLHYLEQQGLFVIRSGEDQEITYTCHELIRGLLCDELRRQSPERFVSLHQRAAELFHAAGNTNQAIYHALQANAWRFTEAILREVQEKMLAQGQVETLARWIDGLLSFHTPLHPTILLARAKIHLLFGEYAPALSLLDAASQAIAQQAFSADGDDASTLQAEVTLLRSKVLFQKKDYAQAQAFCQQVLDTLSVDEIGLRAEAYTRLGVGANLLGDFRKGLAYLQKALHLCGRDAMTRQTADLHSALASAYGLIGNFALAEHHVIRARTCWEHLHNEWGQIDNLIRVGLIRHYQGEFAEAEAHFTQALKLSRGSPPFHREEAYILVSLGELYLDQELYSRALTCLDDGLTLALQMEDTYLKNYVYRMLAMTHLFMGDANTALLLVAEIDLRAESSTATNYERALRELVYGTILLYQKRFSEAYSALTSIEGALREMGLRREQVQLTLRISACLRALGQQAEAIRRVEELAAAAWYNDMERFITTELHRLPEFESFVKKQPAGPAVHRYLNKGQEAPIGQDIPETLSSSTPSPVIAVAHSRKPTLHIQALGEPTVTLDGVPITHWHLARAMELVFFLLEKEHPVHKELILVALWPETEGQVEQTLRTNVYYARKALGGKTIVYQAGSYRLNLTSFYETEYDVALFQDHYTRGKKAVEAQDTISAREELFKAVDLYQGDYLQSFYSDWCIFRRNELRNAYLDARHSLAQMAWSQERVDESLSHWKHILIVDSCHEGAHYGLMRCYLRQGKRSLALRQYQRCAEALKNELGVEPGPAIRGLYQRLITASEKR